MENIKKSSFLFSKNGLWSFMIFSCVACLAASFIPDQSTNTMAVCGAVLLIVSITIAITLLCKKTMTWQKAIVLIIAVSILLRILYVLYTPYTLRQHDVRMVSDGKGHIGYIQYIAANLSLPNTNYPDQFYHPPLHHMIAAVFYRLLSDCGMSATIIAEKLQFLTAFYSCISVVICDQIFTTFKLQDKQRFFADCLVCFHPALILAGGCLNNDILCCLLCLISLLFYVKWWNEEKTSHLILCGLFLGLAMMAKIHAAFLALPFGLFFILKLSEHIRHPKKTILQYLGFGAISIPIGMWYPIRNYILFDQQLTYIPFLGINLNQYVGDYSVLQRLFYFPSTQLLYPYQCWGDEYSSEKGFNVILGMFKTSVLGGQPMGGGIWSNILLYSFILISLIGIISLLMHCLNSKIQKEQPLHTFIFIGWLALFSLFISFCLGYAHICTEDFRYLLTTIPMLAGYYTILISKSKKKWITISSIGLLSLFCLSSYMIYAIPFVWGI